MHRFSFRAAVRERCPECGSRTRRARRPGKRWHLSVGLAFLVLFAAIELAAVAIMAPTAPEAPERLGRFPPSGPVAIAARNPFGGHALFGKLSERKLSDQLQLRTPLDIPVRFGDDYMHLTSPLAGYRVSLTTAAALTTLIIGLSLSALATGALSEHAVKKRRRAIENGRCPNCNYKLDRPRSRSAADVLGLPIRTNSAPEPQHAI